MIDRDEIESAIRHIETALDVDPWACEIAVIAMKQMIPQKPIKRPVSYNKNLFYLYCPRCKSCIGIDNRRTGVTHAKGNTCDYCGKAIDWGEEEEHD